MTVASRKTVEDGVLSVVGPVYPLLADPEHEVADSFNVYDVLRTGNAGPAVFVIDTNGDVAWSHVGGSRTDRPSPSQVLKQLP